MCPVLICPVDVVNALTLVDFVVEGTQTFTVESEGCRADTGEG